MVGGILVPGMARRKKSPVPDVQIAVLGLLMLGALAAISIRLGFIQLGMNAYYSSRIQGRSEVTVRILLPAGKFVIAMARCW